MWKELGLVKNESQSEAANSKFANEKKISSDNKK